MFDAVAEGDCARRYRRAFRCMFVAYEAVRRVLWNTLYEQGHASKLEDPQTYGEVRELPTGIRAAKVRRRRKINGEHIN